MQIKKIIESTYLKESSVVNIFFDILLNNNSFVDYLQNIAKSIAIEKEESKDE